MSGIEIGDYIRFFPSPAGNSQDSCLILAHGATVPSKTFNLPHGVTLLFYAAPGRKLTYKGRACTMYSADPDAFANDREQWFLSGQRDVEDQILKKILEDHAHKKGVPATSYGALKKEMRKHYKDPNTFFAPHCVSIRNRTAPGMRSGIWLSTVIANVTSQYPHVTRFFSKACRTQPAAGSEKEAELVAAAGQQSLQQ